VRVLLRDEASDVVQVGPDSCGEGDATMEIEVTFTRPRKES
jgi:hypothetical protein